ncbi:MAG TPA: hypothetical protein V6D06_15065 [Trichocoleus sp.]
MTALGWLLWLALSAAERKICPILHPQIQLGQAEAVEPVQEQEVQGLLAEALQLEGGPAPALLGLVEVLPADSVAQLEGVPQGRQCRWGQTV